jgi:hypothetical protein
LTPIDSGHAKLGDDVTLKLIRPLIADGATVLPADWIVHGKVTKVKRASKNCQEGEVAWKLDRIKTPGGDQLKTQEVYSYPLKLSVSGEDPVWVSLDTPLTKAGGAAKTIALLPVVVALSPLLVPMGIAASGGNCGGKTGTEKSLPLGLGDLYAVSKTVRIRPAP